MTPLPPSADPGASEGDAPADPTGEAVGAKIDSVLDDKQLAASADDADDSLEAILLQASFRSAESAAAPKLLGSKTLMGIGIEGLGLPQVARGAGKKSRYKAKAKENDDAEPDVPVDDLVDESAAAKTAGAAARTTTSVPGERPVPSLVDEVALALNVQASEFRDRARGKLPGMPTSTNPPGALAKPAPTPLVQVAGQAPAEFEDPTEGPTALTPGVVAVDDLKVNRGQDVTVADFKLDRGQDVTVADFKLDRGEDSGLGVDVDADEEAVVLGHPAHSDQRDRDLADSQKAAGRTGATSPVSGVSPETASATPAAGTPASGTPVVMVGSPPGAQPRPATPAGGLPAPPSGRVRLPTPMPGPQVSVPGQASAMGRLTLPLGAASPVNPDLTATAPSTPISIEASRRVAAEIGAGRSSAAVSAVGSGPVTGRRKSRITQRVLTLTSGLPAILTAHVKLATVSLAGLIAVTFVGGLFVGMLVWRGQSRFEPTGATHASAAAPSEAPAAPTATTAAGTPSPDPTSAAPAPAHVEPPAAALAAAHVEPPATTPAATPPATPPAPTPAAAHAAPAVAAPAVAHAPPSVTAPVTPAADKAPGVGAAAPRPATVAAGAGAGAASARGAAGRHPAETVVAPLPPSTSDDDELASKPAKHPVAAAKPVARPRRPAADTDMSDTSPAAPAPKVVAAKPAAVAPAPKVVAAKPAAAPAPKVAAAKPAVKPAATTPPTSKPMATNAAARPATKPKTKPIWHDPFAD